MAIDCRKCGTGYCPVCRESCPGCGEVDVADPKIMQTRKQVRDHMNRNWRESVTSGQVGGIVTI